MDTAVTTIRRDFLTRDRHTKLHGCDCLPILDFRYQLLIQRRWGPVLHVPTYLEHPSQLGYVGIVRDAAVPYPQNHKARYRSLGRREKALPNEEWQFSDFSFKGCH